MTDKEKKAFKNLKVGKTFTCGSKKLKVSESEWEDCDDCVFDGPFIPCEELQELGIIPQCNAEERKDKKYIIFEEAE